MIGANRAWVDPAFMFLLRPLEGGEPISFQLRVENVGREPAIDAVFRFQISLVEYIPLIGSQPPAIPRNAACDALEPDATAGIVLYSTNIPGLKNWTVHTFDDTPENRQISLDAVSRRGSIVIDGCAAYRTLGQKHTVAFRIFCEGRTRAKLLARKGGRSLQRQGPFSVGISIRACPAGRQTSKKPKPLHDR
jgi:hypothetical protein